MCPHCHSRFLLIKRREGFERLVIAVTGKRHYECLDCHEKFRIKDRRRFDRQEDPDWAPLFAKAANSPGLRFENWRMRLSGKSVPYQN